MTKEILGLYKTVEETRNAISVFELQGHASSNVVIFANNLDDSAFEFHHTVKLTDDPTKVIDQSLLEKVKQNFPTRDVPNFNSIENLMEHGLSEEDATKALAAVHNGDIAVIVDCELRMGNS